MLECTYTDRPSRNQLLAQTRCEKLSRLGANVRRSVLYHVEFESVVLKRTSLSLDMSRFMYMFTTSSLSHVSGRRHCRESGSQSRTSELEGISRWSGALSDAWNPRYGELHVSRSIGGDSLIGQLAPCSNIGYLARAEKPQSTLPRK